VENKRAEKQKMAASAMDQILPIVQAGDVCQLVVAVVNNKGQIYTAVVADQSQYITLVGAMEMVKLEVLASCAPDAEAMPEAAGTH
jgi:hypothetical protein